MRLLILTLIFTSLPVNALAFSRGRVAVDPVTESTVKDGDATGLAEGCGQQPSPLGMFCRLTEGAVAPKSVFFIGPPAQCDRDACVFVKVYNEQGQLVAGPSIPKGKTRVEVAWKDLLGRDTIQVGDRGLWSFVTTVYYKDPDGRERESVSKGDIVLRVLRAGYVPLHASESDPAFVWTWVEGDYLYRMTSGLRAYVGKVN
jgi:hypothetical protein